MPTVKSPRPGRGMTWVDLEGDGAAVACIAALKTNKAEIKPKERMVTAIKERRDARAVRACG